MKKIILIVLILIHFGGYAQNILRVNNTVGINVPYTSVAAAMAAAATNDIIMVEGSASSYGDITVSKKVSIVGPGYFLGENTGIQASPNSAVFGTITIATAGSGASISGLYASNSIVVQDASNINISGCWCANAGVRLYGIGNNIVVASCYMSTLGAGNNNPGSANFPNVIITNNYISGVISFANAAGSSGTISNNVIQGNSSAPYNFNVHSNIFTNTSPIPTGTSNLTTIQYNVFTSSGASVPGADATNIFNAAAASIFVGTGTTDSQWKLKTGSPAIGSGAGGNDCGMYGGLVPYKLSGILAGQLTINALLVPSAVPKTGTLNVKVSAKVN